MRDMSTVFLYIVIGFAAQMIDGSLGMAYGVSCRTFLRSVAQIPAPITSAVIHCAEIPSSLVSGISHLRVGNVDRKLLLRLVIPGMIGGIAGAWFLAGFGDRLEPLIHLYLIVMGLIILIRAWKMRKHSSPKEEQQEQLTATPPWILPLGLAGGFLDAAGGGGWGPIMTSTMVATGQNVKKTIGTVNAAEFLVTIAETTTFAIFLHNIRSYWMIILGLVIGGVIAAPIAARVCKKIPTRPLMALVGILIIVLNLVQF